MQLSLFTVWAFADWCADNYVRHNDWWVRPGVDPKDEDNWKSTAELWTQFSENYAATLVASDPLDDENSALHKIGREIAEMSDEQFDQNCKKLDRLILNNRQCTAKPSQH